jgi:hypothetical protein
MSTHRASGTFDVILTPVSPYNGDDPLLARMGIDKLFHGDLEATSKGEMLSAGSPVQGSAGYVAMEKVAGVLAGRAGTFVLQHSAMMTRGTPELSITVVPDSGTGELAGISGSMSVGIDAGKHSYGFDYSIESAA